MSNFVKSSGNLFLIYKCFQTDNQLNRVNFNLLVTDYYLWVILREMRFFWFFLFIVGIMTNLLVEAEFIHVVNPRCRKGYVRIGLLCRPVWDVNLSK
ncbi:hypothetical protein Trydic_g5159 [Trypoxylus dichotomus]